MPVLSTCVCSSGPLVLSVVLPCGCLYLGREHYVMSNVSISMSSSTIEKQCPKSNTGSHGLFLSSDRLLSSYQLGSDKSRFRPARAKFSIHTRKISIPDSEFSRPLLRPTLHNHLFVGEELDGIAALRMHHA